jgi:hypothetical protein
MKKTQPKWILGCLLVSSLGVAMAQNSYPPSGQSSGGWRRFEPSGPAADPGAPPPEPSAGDPQGPPPAQTAPQAFPSRVSLPAGTWVTIRVNEPISSDHSQPGDAFTATLAEPIVANGLLIARRGQLVTGVVSEAQKAGRVEGTSRLKLELTEVQLADGRQVQVRTQLMERRGNTSYGRDAAAIGVTTATGAAIGAAVNGGVGAGVGAAAGVVASTIGVLLTRGRATVVYPETPLTFALQAPLNVDVNEAFQPAGQQDYNPRLQQRPPAPRPGYGPPPAPYYGGYYGGGYYGPYYPYPYPYFYGPSFYFGYGRGFYGRGFRR